MNEELIKSIDDHLIQTFIWPNTQAKAWVHIYHGMAEHAKRYDEFAKLLVAAGYAVVAHNHRGHGSSTTTQQGIYSFDNGWTKVLKDIDVVRETICNDGLPYYIFAHSMGSFIAQSYLTTQPKDIDGLILSGSNFQSPALAMAGRFIARVEGMRLGKTNSSKLLQFLSFSSFNQAFKPNRTEYDWLSRDQSQVDKYIADPLCGFACKTGLWHDFLNALVKLFSNGGLSSIQKNLPIYIFGGDRDPVGLQGKGLIKLHKAYETSGQTSVSLKLYKNGRHEMLNEINKEDVMSDVIGWLESQTAEINQQETVG